MLDLNSYVKESEHPKKLILGSFPAIHNFNYSLSEAYQDPAKIADLALKFDSMLQLDFIRTITDLAHECEIFGAEVKFPPMSPPRVAKATFSDLNQLLNNQKIPHGYRYDKYLESYSIIKGSTATPLIASLTGPLTILGSLIPYTQLKDSLQNKESLKITDGIKVVVNQSLVLIEKLNKVAPDILMISDPLASFLEPEEFKDLLIPYYNLLFTHFCGSSVLHICGDITKLLPLLNTINCFGLSIDEMVDINNAISKIQSDKILFGNISPINTMVNGSREKIEKETRALITLAKKHSNFVPATGCTLPHYTPLTNIKTFLKS